MLSVKMTAEQKEKLEVSREVESAMMEIGRIIKLTQGQGDSLRDSLFGIAYETGHDFKTTSEIALRFAQAIHKLFDAADKKPTTARDEATGTCKDCGKEFKQYFIESSNRYSKFEKCAPCRQANNLRDCAIKYGWKSDKDADSTHGEITTKPEVSAELLKMVAEPIKYVSELNLDTTPLKNAIDDLDRFVREKVDMLNQLTAHGATLTININGGLLTVDGVAAKSSDADR